LLRRLRRLAIGLILDLARVRRRAGSFHISRYPRPTGKTRIAGCYCGCAQSKTSAGCTKMCGNAEERFPLGKPVRCAKPRVQPPPKLRERAPTIRGKPRAERASN